jgi:hypothetical protein
MQDVSRCSASALRDSADRENGLAHGVAEGQLLREPMTEMNHAPVCSSNQLTSDQLLVSDAVGNFRQSVFEVFIAACATFRYAHCALGSAIPSVVS